MATLNFLKVNPLTSVKQKVLTLLQNSKIFVKKGDVDFIANQLQNIDIVQSFIPSEVIEQRSVVTSDSINKKLEGAYIDHLIQYAKLKNLLDGMEEVNQLFQNKVQTAANQILDYESRVKTYKKIQAQKGVYNTILHETFNYDNNFDGSDRKLSVNKIAGTLRLNSSGKLLTTKETSNLSYEILTEGVFVIDENPIDNLFNRNTYSPWFLSLVSRNIIKNNRYAHLDITQYPGIVVMLRVTLPSVQQISRIAYSYFSTDVMDLLGVFYSETYGMDLNSINLKTADVSFYQDADDTAKELNLIEVKDGESQIINAAEIFIVFGQKDFITVDNSFLYDKPPSIPEFQKIVEKHEYKRKKELYGMEPRNRQGGPFFDVDKVMSEVESIGLKTGDKNYIVGLNLFSVENLAYEPYGIFRSAKFTTNGNCVAFSLNVSKKENYSIREAVELYRININGERIPVTTIGTDGKVKDASLIVAVDAENNEYSVETNFIPAIVNGKFKSGAQLFIDRMQILESEYSFVSRTQYGWKILIVSPIAHEGAILTMSYEPATIDHSNTTYDPSQVDMIKVFGKPNIDVNFLTHNPDDFVYIQRNDDEPISFIEGRECVFTEIEGKRFLGITKTSAKGITPKYPYSPSGDEVDQFDLVTYWYIEDKYVAETELDLYLLLKNHSLRQGVSIVTKWSDITWDGISSTINFLTEYPYLRNLIMLEVDKNQYRIEPENQYSIDETGNIKNKREVKIPVTLIQNATDIKIHYTPLFRDASFLESNILNHNDKERFERSVNQTVKLSRYPYLDVGIVSSGRWALTRGIFYHINNFSLTYEPIIVRVNKRKAFNATKYRQNQEDEVFGEDEITYTIKDNEIVFDREVTNIEVETYFLGNSFNFDIEMYKGDSSKYFTTPELKDYNILVAVKK